MAQHTLDGIMGLAGVCGAENRRNAALHLGHGGKSNLEQALVKPGPGPAGKAVS
jgi:hypothetical protein